MITQRTRIWWNKHRVLLRDIQRRWTTKNLQQHSIVLLEEPRLVFNPPVRKEKLQRGKGWLSKRFFEFDQLFAAWGK